MYQLFNAETQSYGAMFTSRLDARGYARQNSIYLGCPYWVIDTTTGEILYQFENGFEVA